MSIPALALAQRALVLDARGRTAGLLRGLLVVLSLLALVTAIASSKWFGAPGLNFYSWLGHVNFWFIVAFGISEFTTVVTEEKEEGTLGLLQLAGFGGLSILVGKSIGQLLTMLLLLLVQVPFALLAFTLGGVSRYQIGAGWLLLGAQVLFVYALSLLASVVARDSSAAARLCGVVLLGYYAVPSIGAWGQRPGGGSGPIHWLHETSALHGLELTSVNGYSEPLFGPPMVFTLAAAAVMFGLAALLFAPCTRGEPGTRRERPQRRPDRFRPGNHAVFWKDFAFGAGGRRGLLLRCLAYGVVVLAVNLSFDRTWIAGIAAHLTLTVLVLAMGLDVGSQCGRVFRDESTGRTLPMLMILPVPLHRWAYAKAAACATLVSPPLLCFCLWSVLAPKDSSGLFRYVLSEGGGFYLLAVLAFGLHLTVWLSLLMPRGALAVALLVTYLGSAAVSTMLFQATPTATNSGEQTRWLLSLLLVGLALGMHPAIGRLLRRRAAE